MASFDLKIVLEFSQIPQVSRIFLWWLSRSQTQGQGQISRPLEKFFSTYTNFRWSFRISNPHVLILFRSWLTLPLLTFATNTQNFQNFILPITNGNLNLHIRVLHPELGLLANFQLLQKVQMLSNICRAAYVEQRLKITKNSIFCSFHISASFFTRFSILFY